MYRQLIPNVAVIAFVTTMSITTFPGVTGISTTQQSTIYQIDQQPFSAPPPEIQTNAQEHESVITHGSRTKHEIALTFDADMNPYMKRLYDTKIVCSWYNTDLITILNKTQTKATLFLSGMWIEMYPAITQELAANPLFELSNHSYSHPSFDGHCYGLQQLPDDKDEQEIGKTQALLRDIAHVDNSYFRFPGGCYSTPDVETVTKLGMKVVHWDVVGGDGFTTDTDHIVHNVLSRTQSGSIIILHMHGGPNAPKTAQAVAQIIPELKKRGYSFVKVSELLSE